MVYTVVLYHPEFEIETREKDRLTIQGIIFDLDGTLVDTLDDLSEAMNAALAQLNRPTVSREQCREMIGYGLRKFAELALGPDHAEHADALVARMVAVYREHCLDKTVVYDGMADVIATLSDRGIRLAVLTNKNQSPAETITHHYFGADTFDIIVGAVDGRPAKPDPQTTLNILRRWNLGTDAVLFVGDSETDIRTARAAGVRGVGCEWGFRTKAQLLDAGADILIQHPAQILNQLG